MSVRNPGVALRELWAWAMYDFANSSYTTVILTAVFSTYFVSEVAGNAPWATFAWTAALSVSYLAVMLTMPWLGARADARGAKRRLLFCSTVACLGGTAAMASVGPGAVALAVIALAISNYGYGVGESAVGSFLPELARPESLGRVSGWGWGLGYFGGMLTLGLALIVVLSAKNHLVPATTYVPWVVGLTCLVFGLAALPSFLLLRERAGPSRPVPGAGEVLGRLLASWREVGAKYPEFRAFLYCLLAYQAGIAVVITLSAVYASMVMGFDMVDVMKLIFVVNIAAALGALSFGFVQDRIGHRPALALTLCGWLTMVGVAYAARTPEVFWVAATLAGLCMGTSQSTGRALTGALAPRARLGEFYGLWSVATQCAAVIGPLCYGTVTWVSGGDHRLAILACGGFFLLGLVLLARVNVRQGLTRVAATGLA